MPKVTILVCTYNKKETIEKCLDSLLSIDFGKKEIIVVDGFSADGTFEVLKSFRPKNKVFRKRGGYSAQLNLGIEKAKGEFIALTDADCIVDKDWIKSLLSGFTSPKIAATAGFCGTPSGLGLLQTVIGIELESRINRYPKFLERAPTMNLMVRKEIASKVKFDEKIKVSVEQDFGYRLTKFGKIKYVPEAKIWHHHRSSLKEYFHQQANYAKGAFWVYLKHKSRLKGDNITGFFLIVQIPILTGIFGSLLLSLLFKEFVFLATILTGVLLFVYFKELILTKPRVKFVLPILFIFLFRNIAWIYGFFQSLIPFITRGEPRFKI